MIPFSVECPISMRYEDILQMEGRVRVDDDDEEEGVGEGGEEKGGV